MQHVFLFTVAALAALLATCFVAAAQPVVVTPVNSTYIYAETMYNRLDIHAGNVTLRWRSPDGVLRENDQVRFLFSGSADTFYWKFNDTQFNCMTNTTATEPFASWQVWTAAGPNGSTIIGTNATNGVNCQMSVYFHLTNIPLIISVGGVDVPVDPKLAKMSVRFDCPWRASFNRLNSSYADVEEVWLYGRKHITQATLEFGFSSQIVDWPKVKYVQSYANWSKWETFVDQLCFERMPEFAPDPGSRLYQTRPVPPGFDFLDTGTMYVPSEDFAAGMEFLGWAVSDDVRKSEVGANGLLSEARGNPITGDISIPFDLAIFFQEHALYDPTMQLLFYTDLPPSAAPSEQYALGLGIGIPAALICVGAAVVAVVLLVQRNKMHRRESARIKKKLDSTRINNEESDNSAATSPQRASSSPPSQGWKQGVTRNSTE